MCVVVQIYPWFFIFLCFILIIIQYHTQKQRKTKIEPQHIHCHSENDLVANLLIKIIKGFNNSFIFHVEVKSF